MSITNIHAAKTNLSKLIDAALRGEEVVIAKSGKPLVKIVAVEPAPAEFDRKALIGAWAGRAAWPGWDEWKQMDADIEASFGAPAEKDAL
ncbi:type II toxin-antitoxin system prevent-host-death family antitoxin [Methylosinus sp. H3A]|uniref:type II toxin-antitoxin system Phd/YefM family antitoxin n=1 Tax=Methylosinus sp. H3A TaxID=2785786 RepID=UPI0018C29B57|nr:type II toxin-antitoxin system prevent-host-death family antitoxin [Methylosinus sp. H3A]MBG0809826.1 type II toxin-antitoxin system prevent-host-death family antitoxin [Methylosinus sp. H3A]